MITNKNPKSTNKASKVGGAQKTVCKLNKINQHILLLKLERAMNRLYKILLMTVIFSLLISCEEKSNYQVKIDVRLGSRFYSINVDEYGEAYVVKGKGSGYTQPFKTVISSETSKIFSSDAMRTFFNDVKKIKDSSIIIPTTTADAARVELYYSRKKIFDSYGLDKKHISLFIPIMGQLPKGFNPFITNDHPFD